jgi:N-acetylglutamate synthase-like GNAT family acetyltransferase
MNVTLRAAAPSDAAAIHSLVLANLDAGHLLPRSIDEIRDHVGRFFVAERQGQVVGCAELARLSATVAEVRSLVVDEALRGHRIGTRLVAHLASKATAGGYATLCAFTHAPGHFVRLGFTIVPHIWMPEKIAHDCNGCALFRRCGQYAVRLALRQGVKAAPERTAVMARGRGVAPRRFNIERLTLAPVAADKSEKDDQQAVLA